MWFYINSNVEIKESNLCRINFIKGQESNHNEINFILNENNDIEVKINSNTLKELDGKKFELKKKCLDTNENANNEGYYKIKHITK